MPSPQKNAKNTKTTSCVLFWALCVLLWPYAGRSWRHRCLLPNLRSAIILVALLLAGCGLEPVYVRPSPAAGDGTFIWLDSQAAPPEGYAPVVFAPPDGAAALTVCAATVTDSGPGRGSHSGMVVSEDHTAEPTCWIPDSGRTLRLSRYHLLWGRAGAIYRWEQPESTLVNSRFSRSNRIFLGSMDNTPSEPSAISWLPCAGIYADRWYLGKVSMGEGVRYGCEIPLGEESAGIRDGALVLYAPADE